MKQINFLGLFVSWINFSALYLEIVIGCYNKHKYNKPALLINILIDQNYYEILKNSM